MDNDFNKDLFVSYVGNVFVKLLTGISTGNLDDVKHFLDKSLIDRYNDIILNNEKLKQRMIYDEVNVRTVNIVNSYVQDNKNYIDVNILAKYIYCVIDEDGNTISGDDSRSFMVNYKLTFAKKINNKEHGIVRKCPGCGASIDVNGSGTCKYCGAVYNLDDYDYVLMEIEKV